MAYPPDLAQAQAQVLPFRAHHIEDGKVLLSSRYTVYSYAPGQSEEPLVLAHYPALSLKRRLEAFTLAERLLRGGIHLVRDTQSGLVAFLRGLVLFAKKESQEFVEAFHIPGGARPLGVAVTPGGTLFFGQYGNNRSREEMSVFISTDGGENWDTAHTFPAGRIRHVHNVVYDSYRKALLVLTGDEDAESAIYLTTDEFQSLECIAAGDQRSRAVSVIPVTEGWIVPGDAPDAQNFIHLLDIEGKLHPLERIPGSSFSTCRNRTGFFVSTGVEPSRVNRGREATIWFSRDGSSWSQVFTASKDIYPERLFQYGNILFPTGLEDSSRLYASMYSLKGLHNKTLFWDHVA